MNREIKGINAQLQGFYKLAIVDPKTKEVVWEQPEWKKNLILNSGMDHIYAASIVDCFTYAAAGVGNRVNEADSGISTITQSNGIGGDLNKIYLYNNTGDISSFTAALGTYAAYLEDGDTIEYANGSQSIVTSVEGARQATVTSSYNIPAGDAQTFTIWKTSQVSLENETAAGVAARNNNYYAVAGDETKCSTVTVGNVKTHRRTWDFAVQTAGVTYYEIGLAWAVTGNYFFSRITIGAGIFVDTGYQLRLIYELQVTYTPATNVSKDIAIGGWAADTGLECIQNFITSQITTATGASDNSVAVLDPYFINYGSNYSSIFASTVSTAPASFGSAVDRSTNAGCSTAVMSKTSYTDDVYLIDRTGIIPIGAANYTNLRTLGLGLYNSGVGGVRPYNSTYQAMCYVMEDEHPKYSTETLTITYRFTWARTLA